MNVRIWRNNAADTHRIQLWPILTLLTSPSVPLWQPRLYGLKGDPAYGTAQVTLVGWLDKQPELVGMDLMRLSHEP